MENPGHRHRPSLGRVAERKHPPRWPRVTSAPGGPPLLPPTPARAERRALPPHPVLIKPVVPSLATCSDDLEPVVGDHTQNRARRTNDRIHGAFGHHERIHAHRKLQRHAQLFLRGVCSRRRLRRTPSSWCSVRLSNFPSCLRRSSASRIRGPGLRRMPQAGRTGLVRPFPFVLGATGNCRRRTAPS